MEYHVVINGDNIRFDGSIFSCSLSDAEHTAVKMAENAGGDFFDVILVELK